MKKENKQLAQERKAAERKKQQLKNTWGPILKYGLLGILLFAFIAVCVVNPFKKEEDSSTNNENQESEKTTFMKDSSLTIEDGDTVNIDYVGSIDGVEFEGGNTQGSGADLVIGSGSYIDDFEEQLIGSHPGDLVDVVVTFPDDYHQTDLAGKEALFKVVVNGIYR